MEDIWQTLLRYDREIATPRLQASEERVTENITRTLRNEMNVHFDAFYKQFGRIDSELVSINAGLKRLETRMDALETRMGAIEDKVEFVALRSKLEELRGQVAEIEQRLSVIESRH